MARRRGNATIVDIARELDLHPTSVSRALSGSHQVSEATRAKVLEVADRLNYVRNLHASGLVTGSSSTLGLLLPTMSNPFFASLADAVQEVAMRHGFLVMVASSQMSSENETELVARMIQNTDAAVVAMPSSRDALPRGITKGSNVAFVNGLVEGFPCFVIDQAAVAKAQIDALRSKGHTNIAFVDGPEAFESTELRIRYRRGLRSKKLTFTEIGCFDPTGTDIADAYRALPADATAVVVFNDIMALGLMAAAVEDGRSIPTDLSVVGSDGLDLARLFHPELTTVVAPIRELAEAVVTSLIGDADADPEGVTQVFGPLGTRGSSVATLS